MRTLAILIILVATAVVALPQEPPKTASAQATESGAKKAFAKLKTLSGSWEGTIGDLPVQLTIRVTSGGSAIMHDAFMARINKITMIYLEGDRLFLTHYGGEGNRPRFEGKLSPDGKSVEFDFVDVAGGTQRGLLKHMVFNIIDDNHHTVEVTYLLPDGKTVQPRGEFQRTK